MDGPPREKDIKKMRKKVKHKGDTKCGGARIVNQLGNNEEMYRKPLKNCRAKF